MDLQEALHIIKDHIKATSEQIFFFETSFTGGMFHIQKISNTDIENEEEYCLEFNVFDYTSEEPTSTLYSSISKNIEELLLRIYTMTKAQNLYYCKINDRIYKDEGSFHLRSKIEYASLVLTNQVEECSVCNENNIVKTVCDHNLCRLCFTQCEKLKFCFNCNLYIKYTACPVCRKILKCDCSHVTTI
jgi:hypothetical protein